jgi:hypothetical protein
MITPSRLRRKVVGMDLILNDLEPGWYLATYKSMAMGWIIVITTLVSAVLALMRK